MISIGAILTGLKSVGAVALKAAKFFIGAAGKATKAVGALTVKLGASKAVGTAVTQGLNYTIATGLGNLASSAIKKIPFTSSEAAEAVGDSLGLLAFNLL